MCLESTSDVVEIFQHFGELNFNIENASSILESFVSIVHAKTTNCRSVKELRWDLFQSKNLEAKNLPPTLGALKPHI